MRFDGTVLQCAGCIPDGYDSGVGSQVGSIGVQVGVGA